MKITYKNLKEYWIKTNSIEKMQDYGLKVWFFKRENNQLIQDYSCEIEPLIFKKNFDEQLNWEIILDNLKTFKNWYIWNIINWNWCNDSLVLINEELTELKVLKIKDIWKYKEKCFKFKNKFYSIKTLELCQK
jgi:hypothetical protein